MKKRFLLVQNITKKGYHKLIPDIFQSRDLFPIVVILKISLKIVRWILKFVSTTICSSPKAIFFHSVLRISRRQVLSTALQYVISKNKTKVRISGSIRKIFISREKECVFHLNQLIRIIHRVWYSKIISLLSLGTLSIKMILVFDYNRVLFNYKGMTDHLRSGSSIGTWKGID